MKKLLLIAVPFLALSFALAPAQTRVKQKEEADFPTCLESAQKAWDSADFAGCIVSLKDALALASAERSKAIRAALPAAPEGYEIEVQEKQDQANPMMAAMGMMSVGNIVEQNYRRVGTGDRIRVTVTADSPMVSMMSMMFSSPAMLPEGSELIEYGKHRAILKTENRGRSQNLQVLIHGKHVMEIQCPEDDEFLFKMFDQAAIDTIAKALGD